MEEEEDDADDDDDDDDDDERAATAEEVLASAAMAAGERHCSVLAWAHCCSERVVARFRDTARSRLIRPPPPPE